MSAVIMQCSTCKKRTAHRTQGVQQEDDGREYQKMVCSVCNTYHKVYTGEEGKDFQLNVDTPDGSEDDDELQPEYIDLADEDKKSEVKSSK